MEDMQYYNIGFTKEVYEDLKKIASERNTSVASVIRSAIALEKWVEDEERKGNSLALVEPDGDVREVVRMF
jgi:predicted CopG family antitoxin